MHFNAAFWIFYHFAGHFIYCAYLIIRFYKKQPLQKAAHEQIPHCFKNRPVSSHAGRFSPQYGICAEKTPAAPLKYGIFRR